MAKGLPLEEAEAKAASITRQIEELSHPVELRLRLVPLPTAR
jgi:hypothetical protein